MRQIIQDLKSGNTLLEDIPAPVVRPGSVLIKTRKSLVSLGTEKMLVEFGKANLIQKARQQPDKVKMVLDKIKTDGLMPTLETVFNKLNQPLPLGYCNVGEVIAVGEGVKGFKKGDRVASNGNHAEFVCIPQNLVAKVPDNVSDEEAAFTVIGAIGLQGIRLLNPTLGETVVVIGLGLIGLLTAELLMANGCKVIGFDFDPDKLELAKTKGVTAISSGAANDNVKVVQSLTDGIGADGVIITASSPSNEIISSAAKMSRKRGRILLVGVIGLDISRADFYEKELTFQVSCSYGPGRYDDQYEQHGIDYPLPFVRWTEKRNFEAILDSISAGRLHVKELITEVVELKDYQSIYGQIGKVNSIASILSYSDEVEYNNKIKLSDHTASQSKGVVGIIGAGNFTGAMILPCLSKTEARLKTIASSGGLTAKVMAKKHKLEVATSDSKDIIEDPEIDLVVITTRHNLHASMVMDCLKHDKHVFVEKPLALSLGEINSIIETYEKSKGSISVGFNRRFSPHALLVKKSLGNSGTPVNMVATMNAGFIPENSWVHDMKIGGGRIIGEACHFIDLMVSLSGSLVSQVCMNSMGQQMQENTDNASILLKFENGSNGVINYFANGSKAYAKERVEVYCEEKTVVIDNFRSTKGYGIKKIKDLKGRQDKGHQEQFTRLIKAVKQGENPIIPIDEIINVSKASILAIESLKQKGWVDVN